MNDLHWLLAEKQDRLPERVNRTVVSLWDEVRDLEQRIDAVGNELTTVTQQEPVIQALMQIPGFGILTATAVFATVGDIHAFRNGRQLRLLVRTHAARILIRLTKAARAHQHQGDPYVRMLLFHGVRSALNAALRAAQAEKPVTQLQAWVLQRAAEMHSNKAVVALGNKLARIAWAVFSSASSTATTSCESQHDLTVTTNNKHSGELSHTETARSVTESLAERSVRRRDKADNVADLLRSVATSGSPAREFQGGPEYKNSAYEAGNTTAADSLHQARNARTLTTNGKESIYAHAS